MKCWKCGKECDDFAVNCPDCGVSLSRKEPETEIGQAMRMLYDRYGAEKVLSNSAYLVNGLGDLTGDTKKVRNQLKMAMDAGLGKVYSEQIAVGRPDASFDERVRTLLVDEAGLSDKAAEDLAGYFDEMIGWKGMPGAQKTKTSKTKKTSKTNRKKPQKKDPGPEIDRKKPQKKDPGPEVERKKPAEKKESNVDDNNLGWNDLFFYEKVAYIIPLTFIGIMMLDGMMLEGNIQYNDINSTFSIIYFGLHAFPLIPFFISFFSSSEKKNTSSEPALFSLIFSTECLMIILRGMELFSKNVLLESLNPASNDYQIASMNCKGYVIDILTRIPLVIRMYTFRSGKRRQMKER